MVTMVEGLDPPKTGARSTGTGGLYFCPHIPPFFETGTKFRRETQHGTQVRNSEDEEWQYFWDL